MTTAQDALALARRHSTTVVVRGDRLHLTAPSEPTPDVLAELRRHKPEILAVLSEPPLDEDRIPIGACPGCSAFEFWRWPAQHAHYDGKWHCYRCEPIPPNAGPCDAVVVPARSAP